ncbi:MAG: hypothetical protein WC538_21065 [Thermoanaerobaculia bacterium]|jgi:hypothetical protein
MKVSIDEIDEDVLLVVVAATGLGGGLDGEPLLVATMRSAANDLGTPAQVATVLDDEAYASVVAASAEFRAALLRGDMGAAGRVLWRAARTPGLVWRIFERKARDAIIVHALVRVANAEVFAAAAK